MKSSLQLRLTQYCQMPWQFAAFGVMLYVATTLSLLWSWSSLRDCEALRSCMNALLVLAFLHYECVCFLAVLPT